ncbi:MAG: proline/glycine betaine ABC transporter permease [Bauldia litoralis]
MKNISDSILPLDDWIEWFVKEWLVPNFRDVFQTIQWPVQQVLENLDIFLNWMPPIVLLFAATIFAWRIAGRGVAIFTAIAVLCFDMFGIWSETMTTLAMVLTAVAFCALVGIPVGILASRSDRFATILRPILDIMQTVPAFVYLVPIVMLFGVGLVPGIIATIILAVPPNIRLTNLGIRQVQSELVEAGYAFGSSRRQVLWEIQVPLASRTIMAGLNQTLMLSLSMVVIAALIGAGGLGLTVLTGINKLDVGSASLGGLGIVLMAIVLDRITQAYGTAATPGKANWTFVGAGRAALAFPGNVGRALGGDHKQLAHVARVAAVTAIAVALVVWSATSVEPDEDAMRTAWITWEQTDAGKKARDGEKITYQLREKRRCTRTPFFESGFLCSFLVVDPTDKDNRRIRRARFNHSSGSWRVLEVL